MNNSKLFLALAFAGLALGACSNNKSNTTGADSTATGTAMTDSAVTDTTAVTPADSTHSFRNDRGTDSVSAGKTAPAKP